jgi:hypothetical protein
MFVEKSTLDDYQTSLKDKYRPPSRGGNTHAWHQHRLTLDGKVYSFLALGSKKWVFKNDTVSFEWEWDNSQKYRNIKSETLQTWDKNSNIIIRGERDSKPWRTSESRLPCSRREAKN